MKVYITPFQKQGSQANNQFRPSWILNCLAFSKLIHCNYRKVTGCIDEVTRVSDIC